jgi:hypothetical protein
VPGYLGAPGTFLRGRLTTPKVASRWMTTPLLAQALSLRFNHEEFCDGHKARRKTPSLPIFADSSSLLEGRVVLGSAREAAFWPPGRSPARFRRPCGRAQVRQKRRNHAMDPDRCQASGVVVTLPGQPPIRHVRSRQPELGESGHHQPRPAVGLLGMPDPRRGPSQSLFEEAEGVLQVEAPDVGAPQQAQVRHLPFGTMPP